MDVEFPWASGVQGGDRWGVVDDMEGVMSLFHKKKMGRDNSVIQTEIEDLLKEAMNLRGVTGGSSNWWKITLKISSLESELLLKETRNLGKGTNQLLKATYILIGCTVFLLICTGILIFVALHPGS